MIKRDKKPKRTDSSVDGAKQHAAVRRDGALADILHDQWTVTEDIDEITKVEHPDLLKMLSFLVCGRRTVNPPKIMKGWLKNILKK